MQFNDRLTFEEEEFLGFTGVEELQRTNCASVPKVPGVYLVYQLLYTKYEFSAQSVGGHYKGKNPTVSVAELKQKWIDNTVTLYIGKAGVPNGQATLKCRLQQFMNFGAGRPVAHRGGRYIWQLADLSLLRVCWKPTPNDIPRTVEQRLIREFRNQNNDRLPFANLRN